MRKLITGILIILLLTTKVFAMEFTAPEAPQSAEKYMPGESTSFSKDLIYILKQAVADLQPSITETAGICLSVFSVVLLLSLLQNFSDSAKNISNVVGTVTISILLLKPAGALINLAVQTVTQLSEYGKLLLPVLATALAAQGGTTSSASLYIGTALFDTLLSTLIVKLLIPILYIFICLCIAGSAIKEPALKSMKDLSKWLVTWCLKTILYVFTGYMSITGVVSGTTDATAIKATKLTISGAVPVVGSILSDASEAILVSAGVMKNAAGVYGLLAVSAMFLSPFLRIGVQYLFLKATAAVCSIFGTKEITALIQDFSSAMGLLLAMTGTVCLLLLISTVCFLKGVA